MDKTSPCAFSIVIPCLNEAETLETCIRKALSTLDKMGVSGEIIVADNGSTDQSVQIAQKSGACVVHVPQKGYGNALFYGITASKGKYILMGDADDSYDFLEIDKFYNKIKEGYDVVMGCRLPWGGGTVKKGAMPWLHRYLGNPAITLIGKFLFNSKMNDFYCGMRIFTREAFETMNMQSSDMVFATEMVLKASLWKMNVTEVPITLHPDGRSGKPHLKTWQDGWKTLKFLLMMCPRWLFQIPGIALMLVGTIAALLVAVEPLNIGSVVFDVNSYLVAVLCIIIGYQSWLFSRFARKFSIKNGLYPSSAKNVDWKIDKLILLSLIAMAGGTMLILSQFLNWAALDFGPLKETDPMRKIIPGVLSIILGVQTLLGSLFMGVLDLQKIRK